MNVLGVCGRDRDAAAALSVDGRVVSAVTEESFARVPHVGYVHTGGFPHASVQACLTAAGIEAVDVQQIVVVDDGAVRPATAANGALRGVPVREVAAVRADAQHAAMASGGAQVVLVCGAEPAAMAVFPRNGSGLGPRADVAGADAVVRAARKLAMTLGLAEHDPFAAIDRLSVGAEPAFQDQFAKALQWREDSAVEADVELLNQAVARVAGAHLPNLAETASLNARLQGVRREIAASFTCQLAEVVGRMIRQASDEHGGAAVAAGGALFGNGRFNTELVRLVQNDLAVAAVPEAIGRAVGAVASEPGATASADVRLGPQYSEEEIKRTLDNCRLDYVYEPDWTRLLTRISLMLAQGKVVGWFQGPMAFGPRAMGTRSILVDPSNKYARQNLNEYLRQVPLDEPLPVAMAPSVADRCVSADVSHARGVFDAEVRPEWRPSLSAALDWRHAIRLHGVTRTQAPRLCDLLELHFAATNTPGLIEANLAGPGEPLACTPRDAVRTVYSSAIDALVIGRFLLMKDYWLLRTQEK